MDPKLHNIFSCPIYETSLNLNIKLINEYCLRLNKSTAGVVRSNQGGWQSPAIDSRELPILATEIKKHANLFKKKLLLKDSLKICNMWVNMNGYKDSNIKHAHPRCTLSGVYYVKVPSQSGGINFFNPVDDLLDSDWHHVKRENYNKYNSLTWTFEPVENLMLLFPSWLRHSVLPHLNKKERVSISFNLR
jgi:uncharacterized protein (TIGR02466 family)